MVDWEQVERLRAKGWDWSRIAEDDRIEFAAEGSGGDPGRQLRTLYYQRRSKSQRRAASGKAGKDEEAPDGAGGPSRLLKAGYAAVPMFGIWAALAFAFPSPVGIYISWLDLAFIAVIAACVLLFALFQATVRWESALRTPLIIGIVLGLGAAGTVTLVATLQGCPTLTPNASGNQLAGWVHYDDPTMTQDGAPVFFFYGSIACPYCSASSWAMYYALKQFGPMSGISFFHSNPGDVDPYTPEVVLASASIVSPYVALAIYEGTDDTSLTPPSPSTCSLSAYVSTYDAGGSIPFVVIGGTWVHAGASLVDPAALQNSSTGQGINWTVAQQQMDSQSGQTWDAANAAMYALEAVLLDANGGQGPSAVTGNANVQADYAQIK